MLRIVRTKGEPVETGFAFQLPLYPTSMTVNMLEELRWLLEDTIWRSDMNQGVVFQTIDRIQRWKAGPTNWIIRLDSRFEVLTDTDLLRFYVFTSTGKNL